MIPNIKHINPTDLRDYAKSLGWKLLPEAIKDKLFVMFNPKYDRRQLTFPLESNSPDYDDAIEIVISKLSEIENKPLSIIISEIQELKDDTLRFKVFDSRNEESFIPLSYAVSAINGAKELFVSAACTVLKPQSHHPRMNRSEALELVEKSRFRHTEKGSFILKVSSPLNAVDIQADIFDDDTIPFVRQATLTINKALSDLVKAIQTDTLDILIDEVKSSPKPLISSNLCKAITNFHEEHDDFDLWIDFKWSASLNTPPNLYLPAIIKIQKDYFSRIDEVKRELRNTEKDKEDVFIATVERLDGDIDDAGQRSGEVILNLMQEDEIIRARTNLTSNQYTDADKAHMTSGAFIKVKGKLHPGNQPRLFTDIILFELILP
jgi:hypothetical protein